MARIIALLWALFAVATVAVSPAAATNSKALLCTQQGGCTSCDQPCFIDGNCAPYELCEKLNSPKSCTASGLECPCCIKGTCQKDLSLCFGRCTGSGIECPCCYAGFCREPWICFGRDADPWQVMVQSHQALFLALELMSQATRNPAGRAAMDAIRAQADDLFAMLRLHARIEDGVFFPAVETKRPGLADRFEEDHRRSAAGRPALLDLLNKAKDSDAAFEEAMAAMRRFCSGNTAHQLGEEQEINPKLPEDFTQPEAIHVVRMMAELDQPSFNGPYVAGVFSRIPDSGRAAFLTSLRMSVSAAQYEEIMKTVRGIVGDKSKQIVPVENPAMFV